MRKVRQRNRPLRTAPLLVWLVAACGSGPSTTGNAALSAGGSSSLLVSSTTTEPLRASQVLQTVKKTTNQLVTIRTADDVIVTTPDHLFARFDGGWSPASRLAVGERLVSSASVTGSAILEIQTREAPGTQVYNLTVERTHTYLVGTGRVLVHNVDCSGERRPTLGELLAEERKAESSGEVPAEKGDRKTLGQLLAEEREQERDELRAKLRDFREDHQRRLEALRRKAANEKKKFNDSKGDAAYENCVYCSLGGLSDYDKLSVFLKDSELNERDTPSGRGNRRLLEQLGLRRKSPEESSARNRFQGRRGRAQQEAEDFMRNSDENTFAIIVKGAPGAPVGHSMIAVRQPDGSIVYIDLQKVPPATYDHLNPAIGAVEVLPTDIDWRFNRQLTSQVRDTPRSDPKRGWPK